MKLLFIHVAHALDRVDVLLADFLAQFADVDIDRAVTKDLFAPPNRGVDLLARDELAGVFDEQFQEGKLLARELNLLASAKHRVAVRVELYIVLIGCGLLLLADAA